MLICFGCIPQVIINDKGIDGNLDISFQTFLNKIENRIIVNSG